MSRLKGQWTVTAGVLPGAVEKDYTRQWVYTSDDLAKDQHEDYKKWNEMKEEAYEYAKQITNPQHVNWVAVDWVWI